MLRVFNHYFSGRKAAFFFAESMVAGVSCLVGAVLAAALLTPAGTTRSMRPVLPELVMLSIVMLVALQFTLYLFDLYDLKVADEDRRRGQRVLKAVGVAAVTVALGVGMVHLRLPAGALIGGALGAFVGIAVVRMGLKTLLGEPYGILLVGDGVRALSVARAVDAEGEAQFEIKARVEPPRQGTERALREPLHLMARKLRTQYVVMAVDEPRGAIWVDDLLKCRLEGRSVHDAAAFFERVLRRIPLAHLRAADLAFCDELRPGALSSPIKRLFDLVTASVLLLFAAPFMLLVIIAIKLDSTGPVFYRQERVGKDGKAYWLWKFRSMRTDAERDGAVWARTNDDRVTRVGRFIRKTRMDEIPQVLNVLVGDMSFVGPRPERPVFVEQLKQQVPFYGLREAVKPGITGWAQIRYPYGASVEDARNKLEFDLYYVKHGSLFLDAAIIFHTVRHVLFGKGAR